MELRKITSRGLKGREFSFDLDPATAIVGPNFGGKTALVDSIRFLCCGRFPEIKKGSWPEMSVTGEFKARGPALMLTRQINAKGTVSTSGTLANSGDEERLDVPLLDPEFYFGLTDRERTNYVFERVTLPESYSIEAIIAEIERLSLGDDHTEAVQKAKQDLLVELREPFNQPSLQEALAAAVETLRTRYTYWNRRQKETLGAVTTLTELKLRGETIAAPATLEAEIAAAELDQADLNRRQGELRMQIIGAQAAVANKKSIESFLKENRIDYDRMLELARAKRVPLAGEFERINDAIMGVDLPQLKAELQEAEADNRKAEKDLAKSQQVHDESEKALEELEAQTECPYCESKPKGWKDKLRERLTKKSFAAAISIEAQSGMVAGSAARIAHLRKSIEDFQETRTKLDDLRRQLGKIGDEIDRITSDKESDEKKRTDWKERLATLTVPTASAITQLEEEQKEIAAQLETCRGRLRGLNDKKSAETRLQQDLVRAGESAKEHEIAAAQLAVTKHAAKIIESRRETMAGQVVTKLLETANLLTESILKSPLAFQDNTIGRFDGSTFIEHHWFSGTEKAIAYIAIAIALSATSTFKLVLLDEFGRLDGDNQWKVMDRLLALRNDGVIDQFVVAGTHVSGFPGRVWPGLKVITVQ